MTVSALAAWDVEAYFQIGTTPGAFGSRTSAALFPGGAIKTIIDGLSPDTRYNYRVRVRPTGSPDEFLAERLHVSPTVRSYGAGNTFDWATSGLATGTYRFTVGLRRAGLTQPYEAQATTSFVLQRRR